MVSTNPAVCPKRLNWSEYLFESLESGLRKVMIEVERFFQKNMILFAISMNAPAKALSF